MKAQPIALVTGATSGIGEATAYRLQARDHVVFAAGRNPHALDALRSRGLQARALDVTDEAAVA
jgi:NADP-dependent 3-hydroxy acid dehydrogenase YdfG